MKKDLKSLIQYSKDILDKHGPEAKSPNKHHPILTHDLIMCLKEIIQPDKGGKFVFRKENIVFNICKNFKTLYNKSKNMYNCNWIFKNGWFKE